MLQYNLEEANNTFTARFGDRIGWTFIEDNDDFVFLYAENKHTYYYDFGPVGLSAPAVGAIINSDRQNLLPAVYSIAVRLDISKCILIFISNKKFLYQDRLLFYNRRPPVVGHLVCSGNYFTNDYGVYRCG